MTGAACDLEFQLDLRALRAAGIVPVFAAGNNGPTSGTSISPANNPEALAVGGTDVADAVDNASSRGPSACDGGTYPDLVAPGVSIRTADLFDSYTTQTGTSMAAPHVSGALALLLSAFPDLAADRQETALLNGARDLLAPGPDNSSGYGRLDVLASYNWLATAPDFTLAASPASATTTAGGSVSYAVDVGTLNGFAGDVSLSLSGLSSGQASWSFTPATVTGGTGTAQLLVTTAGSLAPGSYLLTITGTSGSLAHRATVTLDVPQPPGFTVAAAPASATTLAGGSVSYSVTVGSQGGFAGDVALSLSGLTAAQAAWSFTPATVTGGSGSSTLAVTTASSLAPGTYALTVTGQSGSVTHTAAVNLVVAPPPDFSLAASPSSRTVSPGGTVSYTVSVGALNGFTGAVALTLSGLTASQATWSFSSASVNAPGTSTLAITTSISIAAGTYALSITGSGGGKTHSASVSLVVPQAPDFALTVSPASRTVTAGSSTTYAVTVAAKNGFAGSVSLSPSGLPGSTTASFSPNPVAAGGSSTLTVRTSRTTPHGTFTINVTGKSGALTRQATATLVVR
jgi:hypothetical protein